MKYKGLIFDFNGVLWWDSHLQAKSWKEYSARLRGTPLTDEEMDTHVHGRNNQYTLSYLLGRQIEGDELQDIADGKEAIYRETCLAEGENFKLSPGAVDLLNFLKEHNVKSTIATASEKPNVDFFVERLHLERWFDPTKIIYNDGTLPGKPAPDMYLRAAAIIEVEPKDAIVIEDAKSGIAAAKAAAIGRIIALGPQEKHNQLASLDGVAEVIENLGQIKKEELF